MSRDLKDAGIAVALIHPGAVSQASLSQALADLSHVMQVYVEAHVPVFHAGNLEVVLCQEPRYTA